MRSTRPILALVAAVAFAMAWLAPGEARATILPACELREQLSLAPAPPAAAERIGPTVDDAEQPAAEAPADEIADVPGMAPLSDARGATGVAPPRLRHLDSDGAKVEAVPQCPLLDIAQTPADEARTSTMTFGASPGIVAVLHDSAPTLGPAPHPALELSYPPASGGPLSGVRRGIERPPRSR